MPLTSDQIALGLELGLLRVQTSARESAATTPRPRPRDDVFYWWAEPVPALAPPPKKVP